MFYRRYYIYKITDKLNRIVYVGRTKSINGRTYSHRHRFGRFIKIEVLQSTPRKKRAMRLEERYIKLYFSLGHPLRNVLIGTKKNRRVNS